MNLKIKLPKCRRLLKKMVKDKIKAIVLREPPRNIKEIRQFLGCNVLNNSINQLIKQITIIFSSKVSI